MNKLTEAIIVILGAFNKAMSLFIPIGLALVVVNTMDINSTSAFTLLTVASLSTLFRAVSLWVD